LHIFPSQQPYGEVLTVLIFSFLNFPTRMV
jgi:hypothetical protein